MAMDVRLLALDMDGTVMKSDHVTLSPRNRAAIEAAIAKGIIVVTATGRMRNRLPEQIESLAGTRYTVTSNGAAVNDMQTGELIYVNPLPIEKALKVFEAFEGLPIYAELYCHGNSYYKEDLLPLFETFPFAQGRKQMMARCRYPLPDLVEYLKEENPPLEKINIPYVQPEIREELLRRLRLISGICLTSSVAENAEINAAGANKADGLSHLCEYLGIAPRQVMAMGDNENDVEMMRFAGFSVAPSNATASAKACADFITASNDDDGVALAIEKFLLI